MHAPDISERRPLVFLAVLVTHGMILSWLLRADRLRVASVASEARPLLLLLLPSDVRDRPRAQVPQPAPRKAGLAKGRRAPAGPHPDTVMIPEAGAPRIDWQQEARSAVDAALATAEEEKTYRNLASLSPEQLSWVRQNHLEPAKPGIPWKYRRVEVTPGGFPIIHINDHCVAIPFLMMMVFCQVGHIEPNGRLFDHMRDPRDP